MIYHNPVLFKIMLNGVIGGINGMNMKFNTENMIDNQQEVQKMHLNKSPKVGCIASIKFLNLSIQLKIPSLYTKKEAQP